MDVPAKAAAPEPAQAEDGPWQPIAALASVVDADFAEEVAAEPAAAAAAVTSIEPVPTPASDADEGAAVEPLNASSGAGEEEPSAGTATARLEHDGSSSSSASPVLGDETALFAPAAGVDEPLRPSAPVALVVPGDDHDDGDMLLPAACVDDGVTAVTSAPAVGPGADGALDSSAAAAAASSDNGLMLPAASVDDDAVALPVETTPSNEENALGDEDDGRVATPAAPTPVSASASASVSASDAETTNTLPEISPKDGAVETPALPVASPPDDDQEKKRRDERKENDEVPETNVENGNGDGALVGVAEAASAEGRRSREGTDPEITAEPEISGPSAEQQLEVAAERESAKSEEDSMAAAAATPPAELGAARPALRGAGGPARKAAAATTAAAAGRRPGTAPAAIDKRQAPAPAPMPPSTGGRVRAIGAPAATGARGRPASQAAGAGDDDKDWLDELIELFTEKCSTCVGDDAS